MRYSQSPLFALLILALASGCDHTLYELLLQPRGNVMLRTLECRRVDSDGPQGEVLKPMIQEELDRLTAVYDVPSGPTEARRFSFAGEFGSSTPADIGGAGSYRCWPSSLGTLCVYAERFRGSDDQAAVVAKRQQAVDRLLELLEGWLQTRLGQTREWGEFQTFLKGGLRRDLHNLALMAWAGSFAQDAGFTGTAGSGEAGSLARALLFLSEHSYLLPQELPAWGRALRDQQTLKESLAPLAPLIASAMARRTGIAADAEVITALRTELARKTLVEGLNAALQTAPEWRAKLAEWQAQGPPPGAQPPAPVEILGDLALEAAGFGPGSAGSGDELRLRLALPAKPFYANGTWDAAKQELAWQAILPAEERTPYLAYASWAVPADAVQKERFGRVLLRDQRLADYVLWFQGLSQEEAAEWEAFVGGLRPDAALMARLTEFRFQGEAAAGPATAAALAASRAQAARGLLLEALQP